MIIFSVHINFISSLLITILKIRLKEVWMISYFKTLSRFKVDRVHLLYLPYLDKILLLFYFLYYYVLVGNLKYIVIYCYHSFTIY
jgi:hypothetical protein